jgi:Tfp pilus assembly protein FimT
MDQGRKTFSCKLCLQQGFSHIEIIIVAGLTAILFGIALPPTMQWVQSAEYRASARIILCALREAKSKAIATNLEHRVEFENANKRFRIRRGNRASNSSDWNTVVQDWSTLPPKVFMNANVTKIHLNPMGTSNAGTITIQDENGQAKYHVRITSTGRARIL